MRKAIEKDKEKIVEYLKRDIDNCVYMYIDINTCSIDSENLTVWTEEDEEGYSLIVMRYYDSFQIYSNREKVNVESIADLIKEYSISMVSGPKYIIEQLEALCDEYCAIYGYVFQLYNYCTKPCEEGIIKATEDDAKEIAEFLCASSEFGMNYKVEVLEKQLRDRIRMKLGRSFFIRKDGKMVAHTATFAESDDIAVLSGAVVDKEYRKTDFFSDMNGCLSYELGVENKKMYAFAIKPKIVKWLEYSGRECAQYGKLTKKTRM